MTALSHALRTSELTDSLSDMHATHHVGKAAVPGVRLLACRRVEDWPHRLVKELSEPDRVAIPVTERIALRMTSTVMEQVCRVAHLNHVLLTNRH